MKPTEIASRIAEAHYMSLVLSGLVRAVSDDHFQFTKEREIEGYAKLLGAQYAAAGWMDDNFDSLAAYTSAIALLAERLATELEELDDHTLDIKKFENIEEETKNAEIAHGPQE